MKWGQSFQTTKIKKRYEFSTKRSFMRPFFFVLGTRQWEIVGIQILTQDQILTNWLSVSRAKSWLSLHYITLTATTGTTTKTKLQQLNKELLQGIGRFKYKITLGLPRMSEKVKRQKQSNRLTSQLQLIISSLEHRT